MKQKFNLHTHTARCGHAEGLDIQYVQSAMDAGLKLLGFSEHIPYKEIRRADCRMFYEHKDAYLSDMQSLKKIYQGQIEIVVGYEIEYLEDHLNDLLQMRKECDYMILGQHCRYIGYEYDCYCSDDDVLTYAAQIECALEKGFITYVAHPDYFMLGRRHFSKVCEEAAHRIAKVSIQYNVPLEINLNGFHYGRKCYTFYNQKETMRLCYPYPFKEFWDIISIYGCNVLYGFDAHSPITMLEKDREVKANEILEGIPLNFIEHIELK